MSSKLLKMRELDSKILEIKDLAVKCFVIVPYCETDGHARGAKTSSGVLVSAHESIVANQVDWNAKRMEDSAFANEGLWTDRGGGALTESEAEGREGYFTRR